MATPRSRLLPSLECRIPVYISDGSVIPSPPKRKSLERLENFWPLIESLAQEAAAQFVAPMQASSVKKPFDSPDWIFETKLDGY